MDAGRFPFLFGSQYYRAPTPEPTCWETDFRRMRELGFNAVKYFVQWRWSHRAPGRFYFEDLDRLMDLAAEHGLGVTLNFIMDVSPIWLFDTYPDAKQIDYSGRPVEPYVVGHRQVGGHPGPCYRHPGALVKRQRFVAAAVEHFCAHSAMQMWDVWNEPELCFPQRTPNLSNMVCYCPHCGAGFRSWLQAKYGSLEHLNDVWGRCYEAWEQVELPRMPSFCSFLPIKNPGKSFSIMNALMPLLPSFLSVMAKMMYTSASPPLVMNTLEPLII
jgi:beta-galactosidase